MNKARTNGGFTLVELVVVIGILAILAGVAVPVYSGYIKAAQEARDTQVISAVNTAIQVSTAVNDDVVEDAFYTGDEIIVNFGTGTDGEPDAVKDYVRYMGNHSTALEYYADVTVMDGLVKGVAPTE